MKKCFFVVFWLLLYNSCQADQVNEKLSQIETKWEQIHYTYPKEKQSEAFQPLLEQATALTKEYPANAEPIILQAAIILTNAATENPFSALSSVRKARDLLLKAISINPEAKQGSAFVTLGTLYHKVPGWPIAFGDNDEAKKLLLTALKISPDAIDTNYFYGDFLLSQGKFEEAAIHLKKAIQAPTSDKNTLGKSKLRDKARVALKSTNLHRVSHADEAMMPTLNSGNAEKPVVTKISYPIY